ncbi:MAG: class I SAM-dependent methyltransferase [Bacteroidetes bacterium]|nr:class I SAM-dependent methyltransferase [Bacteroidota bacterium]
MNFLPEELENYIDIHCDEEPELLKKLNHETWEKVINPRMLSGHLQGRVLSMLSHMIKPLNILEIGTYTGYSAICLAEGLQKDGKIDTIDINEELESIAKKYFVKSGIENKINSWFGDAKNIIPTLNKKYDLVFIDADKINYSNYFDLVFDKINIGGYIIVDNVLWSGKVIQKIKPDDMDTKAIVAFNKKIQQDKRVQNVILPVRDGLMILRKMV